MSDLEQALDAAQGEAVATVTSSNTAMTFSVVTPGFPDGTKLFAAPQAPPAAAHSTQDCYEHFLSYSGATDHPWLKYAYFHGADVGLDRPVQAPPLTSESEPITSESRIQAPPAAVAQSVSASAEALAELAEIADGGWELSPVATKRIAEIVRALLAGENARIAADAIRIAELRDTINQQVELIIQLRQVEQAPPAAVPVAEVHAALERDIDIMRDVYMTRSQQEAFDRIKASLSPDREVVARAIAGVIWGDSELDDMWPTYADYADAAIKAMQGVSK